MKRWVWIVIGAVLVCWVLAGATVWALLQAFGPTVRGSGHARRETRPVAGVTRVSQDFVGELLITQGPTESLQVEADDNLLPMIQTKVEDGQLTIAKNPESPSGVWPRSPIRYWLTVRDLSDLSLRGAGSLRVQNLRTKALHVGLSGAGGADVQVTADSLEADLSGAGGMTASGAVREQRVSLSGVGNYSAPRLVSTRASVRVSGTGGAQVNCTDDLDATISGVGSVSYAGRPKRISEHVSGLGRVGQAD